MGIFELSTLSTFVHLPGNHLNTFTHLAFHFFVHSLSTLSGCVSKQKLVDKVVFVHLCGFVERYSSSSGFSDPISRYPCCLSRKIALIMAPRVVIASRWSGSWSFNHASNPTGVTLPISATPTAAAHRSMAWNRPFSAVSFLASCPRYRFFPSDRARRQRICPAVVPSRSVSSRNESWTSGTALLRSLFTDSLRFAPALEPAGA